MTAGDGKGRLVRGEGRYTADVALDRMVFAAFVRSPVAHARIVSIDLTAARATEGVLDVFTAGTLGSFGSFPAFLRYQGRDGSAFTPPPRPPIAVDVVRHVGEIVAVVVARTRRAAEDGAEAVAVELADLPTVIGLDEAFDPARPAIHAGRSGNIAIEVAAGDHEGTSAALLASAVVVELGVELPRLAPMPMEPRAAVGVHDPTTDRYTLHAPHQGAPEVRRDLAAVLRVPEDRIDVVAEDVGGGFGARGPAYPEQALVLRLARLIGAPVAWHGTRLESFMTDHPGRGTRLRGRLGLDADGRFTALDVTYEADLGAYATPVGAHIAVHNPLQTLAGVYGIPAVSALFRLAHTNTAPIGPYRGAGRPDIALLIERLVEESARRTGRDPVDLRRTNLIPADAFPYRTAAGAVYDSGDYRRLLDTAAAAIDWTGRASRAAAAREAGLLHGVGLALFVEVAGGGPVASDEVRLRFETEGGTTVLVVEAVAQSTGQPHARVFAELAAAELGIPADRIVWRPVAQGLAGAGAFASRATHSVGSALIDACRKLGEICADVGAVLDDPARAAQVPPVVGSAPVSVNFPSGCHAAEVTVDPETGHVALTRFVAVDDVGRVLSPEAAEAQVHGGVAQGLGGALLERLVNDPSGQLVTASLMDYALPRADDLVAIEAEFASVPSPANRLGVKGVGEAGTTGGLAAIANAVIDALAEGGGRTDVNIPFTPERVWRALPRRPARSD